MSELGSTRELLERLERHPGATGDQLRALQQASPGEWPADYLECLGWSDGLEGYVGGRGYLWLWASADVPRLNAEYAVAELAPGLVLFGSNAAALGYGFDFSVPRKPVVSVEMSAMHREYLTELAPSFSKFLGQLAVEPWPDDEPAPESFGPPEWLRGKIIHEKHPIVLGGNPTDPANRVLIPRELHPKATVFFARLVHEIRAKATRRG